MHLEQSDCGGKETFPHFEHLVVTNLPVRKESQNSWVLDMGMSNLRVSGRLECNAGASDMPQSLE
jgi:hypothetical protein